MTEVKTKKCKDCQEVKPLDTDFYKAGPSWQSRCKRCHNKNRVNYKNNAGYVRRPYKFKNEDFIKKIKELRKQNKKWKIIAQEVNIPYQSLIQFKRLNNIN